MIYDYWAAHSFVLESDSRQQEIINYLLGQGKSAGFPEVPDVSARLELAAQAVGTRLKEYARVGSARQPGGYFALLRQTNDLENYFKGVQAQLQGLGLLPQLPDLGGFPAGSFTIHFTFTLKTPYLSKNDSPFQLFDNPMRKEWVFKLPYIAPSQWKGALRAALHQEKGGKNDDSDILRLFGKTNDEGDSGEVGLLYFYPSFFDRLDLEVINPHDRETGAGTLPIYLEVVPAGASATFTLLYVPTNKNKAEIFDDLSLVAEGVQAMFTTYGFGAKTSSGFGLAEANRGSFALNIPDDRNIQHPPRPVPPQEPVKPEAIQTHLSHFPAEDFALKPNEWRKKHSTTNSQRDIYKSARAGYAQYQQELSHYTQAMAEYQNKLTDWEKLTNTPPPPQTRRDFTNFATLMEQIETFAPNIGTQHE